MKHINTIKSAIYVILIFLLSLMLFACDSSLSEAKKENRDAETVAGIKVSGKITLVGAGPAKKVSRSATFSMPEAITWVIAAETADYEAGVSGDSASASTTLESFEIIFPTSGDWLINVKGYSGLYGDNDGDGQVDIPENLSPAFSGSLEEISITEDGLDEPLDIDVYTNKNSGIGIVNLAISDISEAITKGTAVFTSRTNDDQPITNDFNFDGGNTAIYVTNIPSGCYTLNLTFEDDIGNVLYKCNEPVNVYESLTTDTWYGNAPYLIDGTFVITQELITAYGAEPVPDTDYVLYTAVSEGGVYTYSYYRVDDVTEDISDVTATAETKLNYCFDADGYFYTFIKEQNSGYKVVSSKFVDNLDIDTAINDLSGITIDKKTNVLYAWHGMGMTYDIYKFPNLISNGNTEYETVSGGDYSHIDEWFDHSNTNLVINDGIMYAFTGGGQGSGLIYKKLYVVDSSKSSAKAKEITLDYESAGLSDDAISSLKFTDVIYQDGALYILAREFDDFKSRGALIKYNTFTCDVDVIGYSDDVKEQSELADVKLEARLYEYVNDEDFVYPLFTDNACESPLYVPASTNFENSESSVQTYIYSALRSALYTPAPLAETLSEEAFYGPEKFIAVKPKKLVIADDGIAFYTDAEGVLKYKNVNRVVTVDLDTFSITTENVNAAFNSDSINEKTCFSCSSTGYRFALSAYMSSTTPSYYKDHNDELNTLTSPNTAAYLVIPCGD